MNLTRIENLLDGVACAVRDTARHVLDVVTATTGTARSLAFQYGTPPAVGTAGLAPRSMTSLPTILEGTASELVTINLLELRNRYAYAGFVANLGDAEMLIAWVGVGGDNSGLFTVPPAAAVQVPCIIRGVLVQPAAGEPSCRYQVSLS